MERGEFQQTHRVDEKVGRTIVSSREPVMWVAKEFNEPDSNVECKCDKILRCGEMNLARFVLCVCRARREGANLVIKALLMVN